MNSSVNPSSELSNSASNEAQTTEQVVNTPEASSTPSTTDEAIANRQQPIPPPSEPMQYRAIGLVRGRYQASPEQFTQGTLITTDETQLNVVLLGRIMSLVKNHLDLEQEHLWVVYPRMGQQDGKLHLQIVGVWEPDKLNKQLSAATELTPEENAEAQVQEVQDIVSSPAESSPPTSEALLEVEDGYFSVRGEIVYQSTELGHFVVKIKQAPRKESDKPKYFKLKLEGNLATRAVGQFWNLQAQRQAESLVLRDGESIAVLPQKPKLRKNNKSSRPKGYGPRRNAETPRPVRKSGDPKSVTPPTNHPPSPKPIKRQKPPQ